MSMWIDKKILVRNFSRYADTYDRYADIQRAAARELMEISSSCRAVRILEVGCGTAYYTRLLRQRFYSAYIKAIDISPEMIRVARHNFPDGGIDFISGDAEDMEFADKFDLVTSNAAFHWFCNFENTVARYKGILEEGGVVVFSIFGPETFRELRRALKEFSGQGNIPIAASNFMGKEELENILSKYFTRVSINEVTIKENYTCLMDLLIKIKYTGVRGNGWNRFSLRSRNSLTGIENTYNSVWGKIEASYQIFFCKAQI